MVAKLKKAAVYSDELAGLCESDKCDARTKLECQVSVSYRLKTNFQYAGLANFHSTSYSKREKISSKGIEKESLSCPIIS